MARRHQIVHRADRTPQTAVLNTVDIGAVYKWMGTVTAFVLEVSYLATPAELRPIIETKFRDSLSQILKAYNLDKDESQGDTSP
jgi:hypothetical protein